MSISEWLATAEQKLAREGVRTARLDALVLLEASCGKDRAYLLAHPEDTVPALADTYLSQRLQHEPIAYILGNKEFYGRTFTVTRDVLIPRPESEAFIELLKEYSPRTGATLLDIGTGSGILAVSAKKEFPGLAVHASDVSNAALAIAKQNATNHDVTIECIQSDLFASISGSFDYIFANLPYVPNKLVTSEEITKEPALALFSGEDGLDCIRRFVTDVTMHCNPGAYIFIEALESQHESITTLCRKHGLMLRKTFGLVQLYTYN